MNERIRELWNQSRNPSGRGHDEEKFAELIVKECIRIDIENPDAAPGVEIAIHFGVEK